MIKSQHNVPPHAAYQAAVWVIWVPYDGWMKPNGDLTDSLSQANFYRAPDHAEQVAKFCRENGHPEATAVAVDVIMTTPTP